MTLPWLAWQIRQVFARRTSQAIGPMLGPTVWAALLTQMLFSVGLMLD